MICSVLVGKDINEYSGSLILLKHKGMTMQMKVSWFFSYSRSLSLENFLHVLYLCWMTNYRSVHISVRSSDKLFDFSYKSVLDSMHFYFYFPHCYWRIYWREEKGGQQWVREDCGCLTVRKSGEFTALLKSPSQLCAAWLLLQKQGLLGNFPEKYLDVSNLEIMFLSLLAQILLRGG